MKYAQQQHQPVACGFEPQT